MDKVTIAFYDSDPEGYAESTIHRDVSVSRRAFASLLRPGARILDLGCGSGRDTVAFREEGFLVVPVDGSEGMCRAAETVIGEPVRLLSFEDLDYEDEFDGVWACASLLHLACPELRDVLVLIRRALRDDGILFASFKKGGYRGYRDGRWYTDLEPEAIRPIAEDAGFEVERVWVDRDSEGRPWTNALLRKHRVRFTRSPVLRPRSPPRGHGRLCWRCPSGRTPCQRTPAMRR